MPECPLLILPTPGEPEKRSKRQPGGGLPRLPSRERQSERLSPKFTTFQQTLDARRARLRTEAVGLIPEEVIVLETIGPVEDFVFAVRNIDGLEWLGEIEEEDIPSDDDFFMIDSKGVAQPEKTIRGRVFLVFTNQQALHQILSLWETWKAEQTLPWGLGRWGEVFAQLRDVRPWGVQDRLMETGVLEDWRERVEHNAEIVPCEIEIWYRNDPRRRRAARDRVVSLVTQLGGNVLNEATIDEIAYHAVLANLPIGTVRLFLDGAGQDTALIQCEQIQFFRASGQMAGIIVEDERQSDPGPAAPTPETLGSPVVALLDGMPLQNHRRLAGRLVVDDPDNYEEEYPANERRHGTSMASLILHGDLDGGDVPLGRRLYVRPILRPDQRAWMQPRPEVVSEQTLVVDLIHRAVRRLFEGEGTDPPAAPEVCIINLSIGISDRLFEGALSPLARLLDWLSWKYRVLFLVSAGNHVGDIEIAVPRGRLNTVSPNKLQTHILQAIASDTRHRRLLSPAEAVNVLTIGALHQDNSTGNPPQNTIQPFVDQALPSPINAQGMGYRRSIKPDLLVPGGRVVLRESLSTTQRQSLNVFLPARPPGQRVAAPGLNPGDIAYTWHSRGTSNATALASRAAALLYDALEDLRGEPGGELIDSIPRSIFIKALMVHSARWGSAGEILDRILRTRKNSRQFKEYITRLLGYGAVDLSLVQECTLQRVTALGGGLLQAEQAHVHHFPLPQSLSGVRGWRRLTITLAWLTPVNTAHIAWRRAHLWFSPPKDPLRLSRKQADWHAVQRGTVQHEILEGDQAAVFLDGDSLEIRVSCRPDAGALEVTVPYALAVTLEVAEEIGVEIYEEIRDHVHALVQVVQGA